MCVLGLSVSASGVGRMLDVQSILAAEGKDGRTDGKGFVIRRRYQTGCLFIRGKRRKVWVARWREDVITPDGRVSRTLRSEVLGLVSEIGSRREALKALQAKLRPINQGRQRPQSTLLFEQFVHEQWEPAMLPVMKSSSVRYYGIQIRRHLLPMLGAKRLCDITRVDAQCLLAEKLKQGLSGSSVHGIRTALGKSCRLRLTGTYSNRIPLGGFTWEIAHQRRSGCI